MSQAVLERACRIRIGPISRYHLASIHFRTYSHQSSNEKNGHTHSKVPEYPCRTRFAPSPTGKLHLGSLRTALFNYLLAKKTNGQFLLRIEDTDSKRTVPGAEQQICNDLRWAGLQWDEGPEVGGPYGPYRQSERSELYREHAAQLLQTGKAYRCFCTHEQLQEKAAARTVAGQGSEYDGTCYGITKTESDERATNGEPFIVRMIDPHRFPERMAKWVDLVRGVMKPRVMPKQRSGLEVYDDAILLKGDGLPTYHLANVVDDQLMKITHVIRGVEWLESTWKHVALYEAFGWKRPEFAHVGLLRDSEGKKLSKREKQYDFDSLKTVVLPEALMNFLALLGWRHEGSKNKEVANMKQLLERFDMEFSLSNPVVGLEKLWFLQRRHAKERIIEGGKPYEEILTWTTKTAREMISENQLQEMNLVDEESLRKRVDRVLQSTGDWTTATEFVEAYRCFFSNTFAEIDRPVDTDLRKAIPDDDARLWFRSSAANAFEDVLRGINSEQEISADLARGLFESCCTRIEKEWSLQSHHGDRSSKDISRALHIIMRLWLAGGANMPSTFESLAILGPSLALDRIKNSSALYQ